ELRTAVQPAQNISAPVTTLNNPRPEAYIDPLVKAYIDESIRSSTTSVIAQMTQINNQTSSDTNTIEPGSGVMSTEYMTSL
ncbi:6167_t:CDS:2, partial [Cetraspora pellucida]